MTPILARQARADRAFERIYRKHAADVYRYALVVLRNQADAEDVTQTTFLNAYRAYERGERPRTPQNWLIAIAHNVCRQRFRQSARRPNEVELAEELTEWVHDEDAVTAADIRRALGHLAFNQRAALVMRELEGRSYQEIAEILSLSVSAVETLIFRARRALREQLEGVLTCREAEFAISRQLDGRLPREDKGALRAHLRECVDCERFARSQRAQRGALKSLAAIPLPQSLASFFGGGGGATVGGGLAAKAAAVGASAMVATGVGYEGVKHGVWSPPAQPAAAAKRLVPTAKHSAPKAPTASLAALLPAVPNAHETADLKPFRGKGDDKEHRGREHGRAAGEDQDGVHKEVSPLPPSRARGHEPKQAEHENRGHRRQKARARGEHPTGGAHANRGQGMAARPEKRERSGGEGKPADAGSLGKSKN